MTLPPIVCRMGRRRFTWFAFFNPKVNFVVGAIARYLNVFKYHNIMAYTTEETVALLNQVLEALKSRSEALKQALEALEPLQQENAQVKAAIAALQEQDVVEDDALKAVADYLNPTPPVDPPVEE